MYTYAELSSKLTKRNSCKVENNTYAHFENEEIIITLHSSTIARLLLNKITLYAAGWLTSTTKDRLNKIIPYPYKISQVNHNWIVWNYKTREELGKFSDGLQFTLNDGQWVIVEISPIPDNKLKMSIDKYITGYIEALKNGNVSAPSGGDCWYCYMVDSTSKQPLGDCIQDTSHLLDHIEESYYVPSMLYNAVNEFKVSPLAYSILDMIWKNEEVKSWGEFAFDQMKSSLKRYLYKRLGYTF